MTIADVASVIAALAGIAAALQVYLLRKQIRSDHERARREKAIDLMRLWLEQGNLAESKSRIVVDFAELLDVHQSEALALSRPFKIDASRFGNLLDVMRDRIDHLKLEPTKKNSDYIEVTEDESALLRRHLSQFLNILEVVATAWRHRVADREILEEEYVSVISNATHRFMLEDFRRATGIYPSIREFTAALEEVDRRRRAHKPPTA